MTGLAFEISDSLRNRAEYKAQSSKSADTNQVLKCEYQHIAPGVVDMMLYAYCYIGILTGQCQWPLHIDAFSIHTTSYYNCSVFTHCCMCVAFIPSKDHFTVSKLRTCRLCNNLLQVHITNIGRTVICCVKMQKRISV